MNRRMTNSGPLRRSITFRISSASAVPGSMFGPDRPEAEPEPFDLRPVGLVGREDRLVAAVPEAEGQGDIRDAGRRTTRRSPGRPAGPAGRESGRDGSSAGSAPSPPPWVREVSSPRVVVAGDDRASTPPAAGSAGRWTNLLHSRRVRHADQPGMDGGPQWRTLDRDRDDSMSVADLDTIEDKSARPGRGMVTAALLLAMAVTALEQTVVSTAMPSIIARSRGWTSIPGSSRPTCSPRPSPRRSTASWPTSGAASRSSCSASGCSRSARSSRAGRTRCRS